MADGPVDGQLVHRIQKVFRHRRKWARRSGVTCFRVYDRDLADQPLVVDWYDGDALVWAFDRARNETEAQEEDWLAAVQAAVGHAFALAPERVWLKRRRRQRGRQLDDGDGQYERLDARQAVKVVAEQGLDFEVNLSDYLDTGLFLDHRTTRALVRAECAGRDVLNLFAYTGAFTCYAAAGGARSTCTVDLSNTYLAWARRNLALNGFAEGAAHRCERADCLQWLDAAARFGPAFDLIVCDPPTFSASKAMARTFSIERDQGWLLERCRGLLRPGGVLWFSTNCHGFQLEAVPAGLAGEELTAHTVPEDCARRQPHRCWRWVKG